LNSINRCRARVFSAVVACALALVAGTPLVARAQAASPSYWFAGTKLIFATAETRGGETAVATNDAGLRKFLARVGATLTFVPGQSYITVTTADRRVLAFAIGDLRLRSAKGSVALPFAPFVSDDDARPRRRAGARRDGRRRDGAAAAARIARRANGFR
jgi:hypothetical protein